MIRPITALFLAFPVAGLAGEAGMTVPRIWDDQALEQWATPIAALGIRPGHFTAAEYYAVPGENLRTYPVYRPDREPPGYWEWLQKQKPQPLVDASKMRTRQDWIQAGETAFRTVAGTTFRTSDPEKLKVYRDPKAYEGVLTQPDGTLVVHRWVVTDHGIELRVAACAACHAQLRADGSVFWAAATGALPQGNRPGFERSQTTRSLDSTGGNQCNRPACGQTGAFPPNTLRRDGACVFSGRALDRLSVERIRKR